MSKFIQDQNGFLVNLDKIVEIRPMKSEIWAYTICPEHNYTIATCDSFQEAQILALEFCLLIASHPQGVFIFNPEHLKSQKELREKQQAEKINEIVEVKVTEPTKVSKLKAGNKK